MIRLSSTESTQASDPGQDLLPLAERAVTALLEAREREGARLASMLMDRLGQLKQLGLRAVPLVPQLVAAQQARFLERWREAMALTDGTTCRKAPRIGH